MHGDDNVVTQQWSAANALALPTVGQRIVASCYTRRILVTLTHTLSNTLPDTHKPHKVSLLAVLTGNGDNYLHRNHSGILALPGRQRHHLQNQ